MKTSKRAFTLIELLLTMAIFSVVSLAVYSTFNQGMKVWKRANQMNIKERKTFLKIEKLQRQIRQSFINKDIVFSGEKQQICFPQVINSQALRLTYAFDPDNKEIVSAADKLSDIVLEEDKEDKPSLKFQTYLSGVDFLSFSYLFYDLQEKTYTWNDEWKEKGLPLAIKINLTINGKVNIYTIFLPLG
jgi:prepilin-type N-terminal cleavage/methylation domain-containing protein